MGMSTGGQTLGTDIKLQGHLWRARVVDNNDPRKLGRVRIRIAELFRDIPDESLPWAIQDSRSSVYNTGGVGSLAIPVLGAYIWVIFMDETPYKPMYLGSASVEVTELSELTGIDYPHTVASIDRSGNRLVVNTHKDHVQWTHVSGAEILIDGSGHIKINTADNAVGPDATSTTPVGLTIEVIGNLIMEVSGNSSIDVGGTASVVSAGTTSIETKSTINIVGDSSANIHSGGNVSIVAGGSANVHASGAVSIVGSTISLNSEGGSSPSSSPTPSFPPIPMPRTRPDEPGYTGNDDV